MHLADYLKSKPWGYATVLARECGLSTPYVSQVRHGTAWPSREIWLRIVCVTEGRVTPNDHLHGPEKDNPDGDRTHDTASHIQL